MSVTDYVDTFDSRGDLYNHAAEINRNARDQERRYLVDLLKIQSHHLVCDAPAGGGYLAEGLVDLVESPRQITCVEPSRQFAQPIPEKFKRLLAPIHNIPCDKACFDRVGSLAGLHHLKDKQSFFDECNRILKPGGLVAFADVLADTSVARFLNGPVDQFTETGHKG
ncbi:MAG: class I SAM-dependent methyltransferase, partial [Pseudomonadota bacterium]